MDIYFYLKRTQKNKNTTDRSTARGDYANKEQSKPKTTRETKTIIQHTKLLYAKQWSSVRDRKALETGGNVGHTSTLASAPHHLLLLISFLLTYIYYHPAKAPIFSRTNRGRSDCAIKMLCFGKKNEENRIFLSRDMKVWNISLIFFFVLISLSLCLSRILLLVLLFFISLSLPLSVCVLSWIHFMDTSSAPHRAWR